MEEEDSNQNLKSTEVNEEKEDSLIDKEDEVLEIVSDGYDADEKFETR